MPDKARPADKLTIREILNELVERTNSNIRRLRVLEQNMDASKSRVNTVEKTAQEESERVKKEVGELDSRIKEESERIIKLELTLKDVINQLKRSVSTSKLKELESLIDVFNPLKSEFVTREEVENLIEERLGESKRLIRKEE